MNSPRSPETSGRNGRVLDLLNEDADQAAVASFVELCRQSTALRSWLWQEFAASPKTRVNFARFLDSPNSKAVDRRDVTIDFDRARDYRFVQHRQQRRAGVFRI